MIEDKCYCIDILHQVQAVKSALTKVEGRILSDAQQPHEKSSDLIALFGKITK